MSTRKKPIEKTVKEVGEKSSTGKTGKCMCSNGAIYSNREAAEKYQKRLDDSKEVKEI